MLIERAFRLAAIYHHGQARKYTGEPYIVHPVEVMSILTDHFYFGRDSQSIQHMLAAALLHDVLEDTYASREALQLEMPDAVISHVVALTDTPREEGNRKQRKAMDRMRLAAASAEVHSIKCADIISNTRTIVEYDDKFARVYLREINDLLLVLTKAHSDLYQQACVTVAKARYRLGRD